MSPAAFAWNDGSDATGPTRWLARPTSCLDCASIANDHVIYRCCVTTYTCGARGAVIFFIPCAHHITFFLVSTRVCVLSMSSRVIVTVDHAFSFYMAWRETRHAECETNLPTYRHADVHI